MGHLSWDPEQIEATPAVDGNQIRWSRAMGSPCRTVMFAGILMMAGFVVWGRVATPMAVTELEREIRVRDTAYNV